MYRWADGGHLDGRLAEKLCPLATVRHCTKVSKGQLVERPEAVAA